MAHGGSRERTGKALSGRPGRGPSKASDGGAAVPEARPRDMKEPLSPGDTGREGGGVSSSLPRPRP